MKLRLTMAVSALAFALAYQTVLAQELLTNPGFEDTNSDNNYGDGWGSYGAAGFHAFFGPNGHASLFADNVANLGGVFQVGIPGTAGVTYQFDLLDTRIEANANTNLQFGLEYYAADDSTKLGEELAAIPMPGVEVNGAYYSMAGTAIAGTAYVRPIIKFDSVVSSGGQRNIFVFGASLTAIPEPSSVLLAGLCGFALIAARRRS